MDPITNPYAPGAGTPPPELAGRNHLLDAVRISIARISAGRPAKGVLMVGLRGVGKTVLLETMRKDAESRGVETLYIEAVEKRSLPAMIAPALKVALLHLSKGEKARALALRALGVLAGFAGALKVKYTDIELGLDFEKLSGIADNGDLDEDLPELLVAAGEAAQKGESALVMFVDELQYVPEEQLAALIMALHRTTQLGLPISLVGVGLPQLRGRTGKAKSYAERLFEFPEVGPLDEEASRRAIVKPARDQDVEFEEDAILSIIDQTEGYPYFLQEWGKHSWDVASGSPISLDDVKEASGISVAALDASFFRVRFDRLTPSEKKYLRAMADLGAGPHRSGDIADRLGRAVTKLGPTRSKLIAKGMIWSPYHGDTAFTVPLFDQFMKRILPGEDWLD